MEAKQENKIVEDALKACFFRTSDERVAKLYKSITKTQIIQTSDQGNLLWWYNNEKSIWERLSIKKLNREMASELSDFVGDRMKTSNPDEMQKLDKILQRIETHRSFTEIVAQYATSIPEDESDFVNRLDRNPDTVNFKNGEVDLRTGKMKARTAESMISATLSYDYQPINKDIRQRMNKIREILKQICNNDDKEVVRMLSWLATKLSGRQIKKFLCMIGYKSNNGKTTIKDFMQKAFGLYVVVVSQDLFGNADSASSKNILQMANARGAFLEEGNNKEMSEAKLKLMVGGKDATIPVLYEKKSKTVQLCAKITILSNSDINLGNWDQGIKNRGQKLELKSEFVEQTEYEKMKKEKCVFLQKKYDDFMEDHLFGISLFHLLLPYCIKFYDNNYQLTGLDAWSGTFQELAGDADKMTEFVENSFEATKDENNRVSKEEMKETYIEFFHKSCEWVTVLSQLKRMKMIRYYPSATKHGNKGVFKYLKRKETPEEDSDVVKMLIDDVPKPIAKPIATPIATPKAKAKMIVVEEDNTPTKKVNVKKGGAKREVIPLNTENPDIDPYVF